MAQDRIGGAEVPLTHRFLAVMLGVHRPIVTVTVRALERKGFVRAGGRSLPLSIGTAWSKCPTAPTLGMAVAHRGLRANKSRNARNRYFHQCKSVL
jgi:hypothetical protein